MPYEDIEVRITKSGEIFVKIEGAQEERVRDYFTFLEETIGPSRQAQASSPREWDRPGHLAADAADEEEHREREQDLQN